MRRISSRRSIERQEETSETLQTQSSTTERNEGRGESSRHGATIGQSLLVFVSLPRQTLELVVDHSHATSIGFLSQIPVVSEFVSFCFGNVETQRTDDDSSFDFDRNAGLVGFDENECPNGSRLFIRFVDRTKRKKFSTKVGTDCFF